MRRIVLLGFLAIISACGHDSTPTALNPPPPPPPPPLGVPGAVTINDSTYVADTITVSVGQQVIWTNMGTMTHNVTADDDMFQSGLLAAPTPGGGTPGGTFTLTVTKAGSYPYHCVLHPSMKGLLIVTSP